MEESLYMKLYHGSNVEVKKPNLENAKTALDFGVGFCLTTSLDQAKKWANI